MNLNKKLRNLRLKHNYSQKYVAKQLGYKSANAVWHKENGYNNYNVEDLKALCKLYNINPNQLLESEGEENV